MVEQIIAGLRLGVPVEELSEVSGLSVPDIEAVRNSPLVRIYLDGVGAEQGELE